VSTNTATRSRLAAAVPQFSVSDVLATVHYYRDRLGFAVGDLVADPPEWGAVGRDDVELFFNRLPPGASSQPRIRALGAYDAYFRVSGVDQLAAEFRERGAVIREGPTNRVYDVREVVIEDLNGVVLAFGEPTSSGATQKGGLGAAAG
jgi:catechol 2,3-dioxygenase-like lactoylglutathione lyase family enzyme